jgi:hypothetical protein
VLGKLRPIAVRLSWSILPGRSCVNRPTKPLNSQLNLLLINAPKAVLPDDKQRQLALALVELLISAAQKSDQQPTSGGEDELEADR